MIEAGEEEFGILDLPSGYAKGNCYMFYQTYHGLPIMQSSISRKLGRSLIDSLDMAELEKQRAELKAYWVKYIIIHKKLVTPNRPPNLEQYRQWYQQVYKDSSHAVWSVY